MPANAKPKPSAAKPKRPDPRVERSRAQVLEAARRLLWERGPAAFRVEAVTERTGIALTTIYRHWRSRRDLLSDAIASLAQVGPLPDTGSLRGDLIEFFTTRTHRMQNDAAWRRSLETLPGLMEAARTDPEMAAVVDHTVQGLLTSLKVMLERSQTRGQVRKDRRMDVMADVLLGAVFVRRAYRNQETTDAYIEELVDTMMDVLGVAETARAPLGAIKANKTRKGTP